MISFRYFVEAVIDIQGKLSTQDRAFAKASASKGSRTPTLDGAFFQEQTTTVAPHCMDTSSIRQHKHAIRLRCELVVGTSDSSSSRTPASTQNSGYPAPPGLPGQELPLHSHEPLSYDDSRRAAPISYNGHPDRNGYDGYNHAMRSNVGNHWRDGDDGYNQWGDYPYYDSYGDENFREDPYQLG